MERKEVLQEIGGKLQSLEVLEKRFNSGQDEEELLLQAISDSLRMDKLIRKYNELLIEKFTAGGNYGK